MAAVVPRWEGRAFPTRADTLVLIAGWPADGGDALYSRFMQVLDDAIAAAESPAERDKLERLRAHRTQEVGRRPRLVRRSR